MTGQPLRPPLRASLAVMLMLAPAALARGQEADPAPPSDPALSDPAPPTDLVATDHPWDPGKEIDLTWSESPDDALLEGYQVFYRKAADADWKSKDLVPRGETEFTVDELEPNVEYLFQIVAVTPDGRASTPLVLDRPVKPTMEWFDGSRLSLLVITIAFCGAVVYWIVHARRGGEIRVRKIAGLEAIDEAVGRATEMGRPCLYVPGTQDINEIQTIASMTILARVARTAAEYDAKVEVPTARSLVMVTARETVQAAYLAAGRPDAYNQDLIYYVTDEQFGYVAYLQGMMVRKKPAACFYMGPFYAESLILAETGNGIGAIQVAGTAMPAQLPFFVAACDYTLIGEEFFAASAYLSGSAEELGSLKGQDVGKIIVAALMIVGVGLATIAAITGSEGLFDAVEFLKKTILT